MRKPARDVVLDVVIIAALFAGSLYVHGIGGFILFGSGVGMGFSLAVDLATFDRDRSHQ